jgi:hypothetical protein
VHKFLLVFLFATLLNTQPLFSRDNSFNMKLTTALNSDNTLGFYNNLRPENKSNINFDLSFSKKNLSSQLTLNFNDNDQLNYDSSYINYKKGITNLNIGKVDRIWSFSEKSSLILSSNSRPIEAISLILNNKFNTKWLPSTANWSVELINGTTKNSFNGKDSMLSGARVVFSPSDKLNFEFLQIGQWGTQNDKLYSIDLNASLFGNTNEGTNASINKMAGFGFSYLVHLHENTYRFYSQTIGEDEAGSLPSCLAWMAGFELETSGIRFPTTITFEAIDTRVKKTTHGFCGKNTFYNNGEYNYTNYDTVLGVPIDTEGTSLELFGRSEINKNLNINYSTKLLSINDKDYSLHRLSSNRSLGTITSLGIHWKKERFDLGGSIRYQDIILNKANVSNKTIFSLFASVDF